MEPITSISLTGLGPEPLLRFGELTHRLEPEPCCLPGVAGPGGRSDARPCGCAGAARSDGYFGLKMNTSKEQDVLGRFALRRGDGPPGRGAGARCHSEHVAGRRAGGKKPTGQAEFSALRCVWRNAPSGFGWVFFLIFSPLPPFLPSAEEH